MLSRDSWRRLAFRVTRLRVSRDLPSTLTHSPVPGMRGAAASSPLGRAKTQCSSEASRRRLTARIVFLLSAIDAVRA